MSASQAEYAGSIPVIGSFPPVRATAHRGFRYPEPEYPALPATLISTITLPNPYRQAGRRGEVDVLKLKSAPGRRRKDHEDGAAAGQPAGKRAGQRAGANANQRRGQSLPGPGKVPGVSTEERYDEGPTQALRLHRHRRPLHHHHPRPDRLVPDADDSQRLQHGNQEPDLGDLVVPRARVPFVAAHAPAFHLRLRAGLLRRPRPHLGWTAGRPGEYCAPRLGGGHPRGAARRRLDEGGQDHAALQLEDRRIQRVPQVLPGRTGQPAGDLQALAGLRLSAGGLRQRVQAPPRAAMAHPG